jgi:aminopeptidase N
MEQFPLREMLPLMIDDFKPNILPISIQNLTNNQQILDSLSINIYSKGASLLRLLEYIAGIEAFQSAVQNILPIDDPSNVLNTFYSNFESILNTTTTVEEFLRPWLEEPNYPIVTIDFIPQNGTNQNTTLIFRQNRYSGSFGNTQNSTWIIYIECDLGGDTLNLTANYGPSKIRFLFDSSIQTFEFNEGYLWIKCNKNFYSYQVTEYIFDGEDKYQLWRNLEFLFNEVG